MSDEKLAALEARVKRIEDALRSRGVFARPVTPELLAEGYFESYAEQSKTDSRVPPLPEIKITFQSMNEGLDGIAKRLGLDPKTGRDV